MPANASEMRAEGYRFLNHMECDACHLRIELWLTPQGRHVAMNPMPTPETAAKAHSATCGQVAQPRKKRIRGKHDQNGATESR